MQALRLKDYEEKYTPRTANFLFVLNKYQLEINMHINVSFYRLIYR